MTQPAMAIQDPLSDGRLYRHPVTGIAVPSVTTVIGLARSQMLEAWRTRMVAEAAAGRPDLLLRRIEELGYRETARRLADVPTNKALAAASIGDEVHTWLEAVAKGEVEPEVSQEAQGFVDSVKRWLDEHQPEWLAIEQTVFSGEVGGTPGYAGTFDWIARIDERVVLGDWKTGRFVHNEVAMQLVALGRCPEIVSADGDSKPMPEIDGAVVVHTRPERTYDLDVPLTESPWNAFRGLLQAWWAFRERDGWIPEKAQHGSTSRSISRGPVVPRDPVVAGEDPPQDDGGRFESETDEGTSEGDLEAGASKKDGKAGGGESAESVDKAPVIRPVRLGTWQTPVTLPVRGLSFEGRQEALRELTGSPPEDVRLEIVPDPENPADPHAMGVWFARRGTGLPAQLGYVPRELALTMDPDALWVVLSYQLRIHPAAPENPGLDITVIRVEWAPDPEAWVERRTSPAARRSHRAALSPERLRERAACTSPQVLEVEDGLWAVDSSSFPGQWRAVVLHAADGSGGFEFMCGCPSGWYRPDHAIPCLHAAAVGAWLEKHGRATWDEQVQSWRLVGELVGAGGSLS